MFIYLRFRCTNGNFITLVGALVVPVVLVVVAVAVVAVAASDDDNNDVDDGGCTAVGVISVGCS